MILAAPPAAEAPAPPPAQGAPRCEGGTCAVTLDADATLALADRLTAARRFAEAEPLLDALAAVPRLAAERQFLQGYIAVETGRIEDAVRLFRAVLAARPDLTRARLELARALALLGDRQAADYHYRLAGGSLPPDIARAVFAARALLRDRDRVGLDLSFGLAPDSNINNATADRTVEVNLGGERLPLGLSPDARATSGLGLVAAAAGRARAPLGERTALVGELFARGTTYPHADFNVDDMLVSLAAGPEWTRADGGTRLAALGQGGARWFGGRAAQRFVGGRLVAERRLGQATRVTATLDLRSLRSGFGEGLGGHQGSLRIAVDRVLRASLVATAGVQLQRDALRDPALATTEVGVFAGLGGELPHGLNAGVAVEAARAVADEIAPLLSDRPRRDWRLAGRLTLGSRRIRLAGLTPLVVLSHARAASTIGLYAYARTRVELTLTRAF